MKITKQARREAKQLFRLCLANGLLDENRARQLVQRVIQTKPRGYLAILEYFQRLVKLDYARHAAKVETATPLLPDLLASIRTGLTQVYGSGLNISFADDPALIGGMRITVGSDIYDGSVQGRLAALEERFS
jgi:F-type H+-transporting ATPase subunit delta